MDTNQLFDRLCRECGYNSTEKMASTAKQLVSELDEQNIIHVFMACLSMAGWSQQYSVFVLYELIRKGKLTDVIRQDQQMRVHTYPTYIEQIVQHNRTILPKDGVRSMQATKYGLKMIENGSIRPEMKKAVWEKIFRQ